MIAEIYGPSGRIHYRRPHGDVMVEVALRTPGYRVRFVDRETVETDACSWCGGSGVEEMRVADADKIDVPCPYCKTKED